MSHESWWRRCIPPLLAALVLAGFVAATLMFLPNRLPLYLSVPVLAFLLAYSLTKRFTALSHFWLGAALMLAPFLDNADFHTMAWPQV